MEEWDLIDIKIINHLIDSTPKRFQLVLDNQGESINHLIHHTRKSRAEKLEEIIRETENNDENIE